MKCCIIQSSTITKYGRMDAGFFLGTIEHKESEKAIEESRKRLTMAKKRLQTRLKQKKANEDRIKKMIDSGEITIL